MFKHLPDDGPRKSYNELLNVLRSQIGQGRLAANRRASAQGPIERETGPAEPAPTKPKKTQAKSRA
eukprot:453327-Alexandrium_andersonii.AAC.1